MAKISYDVHPTVAEMGEWIASLEIKSGRSLDGWMSFIKKQKYPDAKTARASLKDDHSLGSHAARWLAERSFAKDLSIMDDDPKRYLALAPKYVAGQYSGKKAPLEPIFARLVALARTLGRDVLVCPCQSMVPLYRNHVFANIKPTTNSRVDLGLCVAPLVKASRKLPARLIDTGGFEKRDRITHRIAIETADQINEFVHTWLKKAYELDA